MPPSEVSPAVYVDFPLAGEWVAGNTPAERVPSHGTDYFGQRFAYDFVRPDAAGRSFSVEPAWKQIAGWVSARQFLAWDQSVYAAFPGTVVSLGDGWPDRLRVNALWQVMRALFFARRPKPDDYRPLVGNYLLISGSVGVALYAHLRNGSVLPRIGEQVRAGQAIARVGNSGNTTMPHLHFHLMDGLDPLVANGILCGFSNYQRFTDNAWQEVPQGAGIRRAHPGPVSAR